MKRSIPNIGAIPASKDPAVKALTAAMYELRDFMKQMAAEQGGVPAGQFEKDAVPWAAIRKKGSSLADLEDRAHDKTMEVLQADDTLSDTGSGKHVTNAQVKKYEDHRNATGNPHSTNHAQLGNIPQADDTSSNADGGKHVTNAMVNAYRDHGLSTANPHIVTLAQAVTAGAQASALFGCNSLVGFTPEGGLAIKITNRTGAASVRGSVVAASDAYDAAFSLQAAEYEAVGVVYEDDIANGEECWVVVAGIAFVLLKDGTAATRGYWVRCADTDGRAEVTTAPSGLSALSTSEHFKEIGHCLENVASGTDVLAKVVLHWN